MASRPSTVAQRASQDWVMIRMRRLSKRSAISPPYALSSSIGRNCRPVVMPMATPDPPESSSTSQSWATRCIQVPMLEPKEPAR